MKWNSELLVVFRFLIVPYSSGLLFERRHVLFKYRAVEYRCRPILEAWKLEQSVDSNAERLNCSANRQGCRRHETLLQGFPTTSFYILYNAYSDPGIRDG
jgi:hypothetical protein